MCRDLLSLWQLPQTLTVSGKAQAIRADFRQVLQVLQCLDDEHLPRFARWRKALRLFYCKPIAPEDREKAMEELVGFITCYQPQEPGPRLLCWKQDAPLIVSGINQVAGREVRQEEFLHWWTFLGYFHAMGPGPLSQVVAIRQKLRTGKRLDAGEQEFYSRNRYLVRLPDAPEVRREKEYLEQLLKGGTEHADHTD